MQSKVFCHHFASWQLALTEVRRRLSTSSVENDDDERDETDRVDEERMKKTVLQLEKLDKDSSIAHVIKQNFEENQKKNK